MAPRRGRIGWVGGPSATILPPARWWAPSRMPNIKQQEKRVRIASRQRLENLRYRSTVKTLQRRLDDAIADADADKVAEAHRELVKTLDRAAARGALHKNTVARRKSQAARLVAGL